MTKTALSDVVTGLTHLQLDPRFEDKPLGIRAGWTVSEVLNHLLIGCQTT